MWLYKMIEIPIELSVSIWNRALEIIKQPAIHTDMLYALLPLLITLFLMQIYFSRYKREELGWNSALGNSVVLLFIGANLINYLVRNDLFWFKIKEQIPLLKTIIAGIVIVESLALIITNFFHVTSKRMAFSMSSVLLINYVATISVILIYSDVSMNYMTLLAALVIFAVLSLFFKIIQIIIPEHIAQEFHEIKEDIKKGKVELKEVAVEKKEQEKKEVKKRENVIQKKKEEIKKIKEEIKNGKDGINGIKKGKK